MANISPFRTPWTAALLLLLVIWSVWLLGVPVSSKSPELSPIDHAKEAQLGRPLSQHGDYKDSAGKETNFRAPTATTKATKVLTETYKAEKPVSTGSTAASGVSGKPNMATETPAGISHSSTVSETAAATTTGTSSSPSDRPLITYVYSESDSAKANIEFFIKHGLHGGADFIFILNGQTKIDKIIPSDRPNVRFINRPNTCFDLGAHAEVLLKDDLYKKYKRFILLNASIRGPYLPYWSGSCWSDLYLKRVTEQVKLVGMTGNCWPTFHVQSMIWATDLTGIDLLLHPPADPLESEEEQPVGINGCFDGWRQAVDAEVGASSVITRAGFKLDVMMTAFHGYDYVEKCDLSYNGDVLWDKTYEGFNVHPYETLFIKANRNIDPVMIEKMTEWTDFRKYSSWDACPS